MRPPAAAVSWYSTVSGKKSVPGLGSSLATAVTSSTVSPACTVTAPCAWRAMRPVSSTISRSPRRTRFSDFMRGDPKRKRGRERGQTPAPRSARAGVEIEGRALAGAEQVISEARHHHRVVRGERTRGEEQLEPLLARHLLRARAQERVRDHAAAERDAPRALRGRGGAELLEQDVHHRGLEGGRDVADLALGEHARLAREILAAAVIEHRGLEPGEGEAQGR